MQFGATKHPGRTHEGGGEATRGPGPGVLGPHLRVKDPLKSTRVRHHCADRGNGALESPALTAPGRCQHALAGPSALEREPAPRGPLWVDACSGYSLQV